jgi:hypothetical protein
MSSVRFSQQIVVVSLNINQLAFVTDMQCVSCAVGVELLNAI